MARPMYDLVVVIPGILGSELRRRGQLLWGFPEGIVGLLADRADLGAAIEHLTLKDKVNVHDLHATILHIMGFDHERLTDRHGGRDYRLTDVHGHVVRPILAV